MSTLFRTSTTDPLWIASVAVGQCGGRVGITLCPGKQGESIFGRLWRRDLAQDLKVIADWGACVVISLIEDHEMVSLGIPDLGDAVTAAGMQWLHLPIRDLDAPDHRFESGWQRHGASLMKLLQTGGRVLVHCRGGLGRAGTVAARMLIDCGWGAPEAIRAVRGVRPGAIETAAQEYWLLGLAQPKVEQAVRLDDTGGGGVAVTSLGPSE